MQGRVYSATFTGQAESAVFDVFEIVTASDRPVEILSFHLSQLTVTGDASEEHLLVQVKSGQTSSGSGGSTATPVPRMLDDSASGATVEHTNTTQASGGTIVTHHATYWNNRVPLDIYWPPEQCPIVRGSDRMTFSVDTAPGAATTFAATVVFREIG